MKVAIIDIDGIVADASARFARAEEIKQQYLYPDSRDATDIYWRAALDPAYVHLDTLIDGAKEAIEKLSVAVNMIVFLTSRPENMREATRAWFAENNLSLRYRELIMKAPGFQYVKTPVWKIGMVQTLITLYGADETIVVDDEPAHFPQMKGVKCYPSLAAVFAPEMVAEAEDPFLPEE